MVERTYISKFNTIIQGYETNTGLNPVSELVYGANISRALVYFDHTKIKGMVDDGIFGDKSKLTHHLRITNAGSLDFTQMHLVENSSISTCVKKRAASFDLIFFLIPKTWDTGKGYDYTNTVFNEDYFDSKQHDRGRLFSTDPCNWFTRQNGYPWDEEGVYTNLTLEKEYRKWSLGEESIVIGRQHFDVGNENINLDITDVVNKFISGELENNGIGIAFAPDFEKTTLNSEQYVGFLTNKTNTIYEPFVETIYHDYISDDRSNFVLNKENKLYLYSVVGGKLTDLDKLPTCNIYNANGDKVFGDLEVKHFSQGVYYVDVTFPQSQFEPDTQYFDRWGGLLYHEMDFEPVELDFTTKKITNWFSIGNSIESTPSFTPQISGINDNEKIKRGDVRKVSISARVDYTKQESQIIDGIETRLYVMDGNREVTIFPFDGVNKTSNENYMVIDTDILVPQVYHLDVKIKYGMEEIIHHDILKFEIVNELENKYF